MWGEGLISEVENLLAAGVPPEAPGLASLGYRQAMAFLSGQMRSEDALFDMIKKTKAYAKRQLTWFRGARGLVWHHAEDSLGIGRRVSAFWS